MADFIPTETDNSTDTGFEPVEVPTTPVSTVPSAEATETTVSEPVEGLPDPQETYTPNFSPKVRTIIYVLTLVMSAVGAGFTIFGQYEIGAYITSVTALIAGGFGVTYNPLSVAKRMQSSMMSTQTSSDAWRDSISPRHAAQ